MRRWTQEIIETTEEASLIFIEMDLHHPTVAAIDTETNGLHIIKSTPFVFQFGYLYTDNLIDRGVAFSIDLEAHPGLGMKVIRSFLSRAKKMDKVVGHNIKFDLHMLKNLGFDYRENNLTDTMFYIRYGSDNVQEDNGGPPMGLKEYAARFIDRGAGELNKLLGLEQTNIAKSMNARLKTIMQKCPPPPARLGKSWSIGALEEFFKDKVMDWTDLPASAKPAYIAWKESLPEYLQSRVVAMVESEDIRYNDLDRKTLLRYAGMDIQLTLEVYESLIPIIDVRKNWKGIEIENSLIIPLLDMERVGFDVDAEYLETSRLRMKEYILDRRNVLQMTSGVDMKIGQHAVIAKTLSEKFGINVMTTQKQELARIASNLRSADPTNPAILFLDTLKELRTLEKWYSAYILRFQRDLALDTRLYTTINQVGAVSGRVTSAFQQFPREGVNTKDGRELFTPRRLVRPTGGKWKGIVYLDYSQIELRIQAVYTILVGDPEKNLCRAYMPFGCVSDTFGRFDPKNPVHLAHWHDMPWYLEESTMEIWKPIDVHAATTKYAFGIDETHPEFKKYRSIGKTINFAKNYGAGFGQMKNMFPDKTNEEINRINDAYYIAFPGVKSYHEYCYSIVNSTPAIPNLFGVKYFNVSGHNLINMLIQGSGAFLMKTKIREIWEFCTRNPIIKSRFQMNIHDELSWEWHEDDPPEIFFEFKRIMENWPDAMIPIVAEMAYTKTTWAEKKDVHAREELQ